MKGHAQWARWLVPTVLVLAFLGSKVPAEAAPRKPSIPRDFAGKITSGGRERTFWVHLPAPGALAKPVALVLMLHGHGGTGRNTVDFTRGGLNRLADRDGAVVVYPDGIDKSWNDGRIKPGEPDPSQKPDDVGFIRDLIAHMRTKFQVDDRRIYAAGISNGAMMCHRLACDMADTFSAVGSVIGALGEDLSRTAAPSRPVSVLLIQGTQDPLVPYEGGDVHFYNRKLGRVLSADATVQWWVNKNGASATSSRTVLPNTDRRDGCRVVMIHHGSGREGSEVTLMRVEEGGHTWPGGTQYLPAFVVGKVCRDIDGSTVLWEFFKRHRR